MLKIVLERIRHFLVAALICWPQPFGFLAIFHLLSVQFPDPTPAEIAVGVFVCYFMFIFSFLWAYIPIQMLLFGPEETLRSIREDVLPQFRFIDPARSAKRQKSSLVR